MLENGLSNEPTQRVKSVKEYVKSQTHGMRTRSPVKRRASSESQEPSNGKQQRVSSPIPQSPQPGPRGLQQQQPQSPQLGPSELQRDPNSPVFMEQYISDDSDEEVDENLPNKQAYTYHLKSFRMFKKNDALDSNYEIKFNNAWRGRHLTALHNELLAMFDDVITDVTNGLHPNDHACVVIHHDDLNNPIIVPIVQVQYLNAESVMRRIESVPNSNEEMSLDKSFRMNVGTIKIPRGAGRTYISSLIGEGNSVHKKKSMVSIVNNDNLCMALSIAV